MTLEILFPEQHILREIAEYRLPQKEVAKTYSLLLRSSEFVNWKKINEAIVERWSFTGLNKVKNLAHSGKCWR